MSLSITDLTLTYKNGVKALDNISLEIGKGMFGLLGPNGAGKSTLMRTIATLQTPGSGSIHFNGIDILNDKMSLRKILGYLPQDFGVYPKTTGEDLLDYFAVLKGISSKSERKKVIREILEITNLYEVRNKNADSYSGGMKQRFGIAQLLLNKPELIIVDEPTAGLDPAERNRFLNVLREIGVDNTVIFSTHIVDDIKDFCRYIAVIDKGRILLHSSQPDALKNIKGKIWMKVIRREELENSESEFHLLSSKYNDDNSLTVRIFSGTDPENGFTPDEPELEDLYFITLQSKTKLTENNAIQKN
ncbi:MAG: ABC transporter ATP-binding protein [Ignavibacteria bacterium]|nr:ABC transporter ATP-binding protein [Ignavibacteria bacterium]MBK7160206.1 ABC transporter ATP-binding protein [Ignavibacteria bacterium]MBK7255815.1 ABC transporter ATP-binding protein [Ignavibacteria bacterium]MBK7447393.1 ABC transporter ATP-binding protein [Ignavibacteria bacterium]MBK8381228.1 ABC transporter ATP-binding protein [Ignavibacteria bacterium]